jgi:hypothetical protein
MLYIVVYMASCRDDRGRDLVRERSQRQREKIDRGIHSVKTDKD